MVYYSVQFVNLSAELFANGLLDSQYNSKSYECEKQYISIILNNLDNHPDYIETFMQNWLKNSIYADTINKKRCDIISDLYDCIGRNNIRSQVTSSTKTTQNILVELPDSFDEYSTESNDLCLYPFYQKYNLTPRIEELTDLNDFTII